MHDFLHSMALVSQDSRSPQKTCNIQNLHYRRQHSVHILSRSISFLTGTTAPRKFVRVIAISRLCVCLCACEREREGERARESERDCVCSFHLRTSRWNTILRSLLFLLIFRLCSLLLSSKPHPQESQNKMSTDGVGAGADGVAGGGSGGDTLSAHMEDNSEQLADFLASKSRLQGRMAGARRDMRAMRATVADEQRHFDAQLQHLRKQVAALLEESCTTQSQRRLDLVEVTRASGSCAPPSTPAEEQG